MTTDYQAIAAAVAVRYSSANLTPPAGLAAVRLATADLPQRVAPGRSTTTGPRPVVLVMPDSGELDGGGGGRLGTHRLKVGFYYALATDLPRETNACLRWLGALLDVHGTASSLGGLVTIVRTIAYRVGILRYAGDRFSGVELTLEVVTREAWTPAP